MRSKDVYSKFEKTRIISARALQIAQGSPILVHVKNTDQGFDPIELAKREWGAEVIPIDIKKPEKKEFTCDVY